MTTSPNPDDNVLCIARDWVAAVESTDPTHECVIMGKHILAAHEARERARREMPAALCIAKRVVERDEWSDLDNPKLSAALIAAHEDAGIWREVALDATRERDALKAELARAKVVNGSLIPGAMLVATELECLRVERDGARATLAAIDTELSGVTCTDITDDVNRIRTLRAQVVRDERDPDTDEPDIGAGGAE